MKTASRRELLKLGAAGLAATVVSPAVRGQAWPSQPIRLVVPFPPGGPTDLVGRVLAREMSRTLGQNVVVENRPGANANIGAELVARAPADGYTLLYNTASLALNAVLYNRLNYDPLADFAPVVLTGIVPHVLVVNPSLPVKTVAEFIDHARKNPGKLTYGSAGNGNITHMGAYRFLHAQGIDAVHVPYKGSAPALFDVVAGQTHFMTDAINSALPYIRDGRLRALSLSAMKRSSLLPDVPTLRESGLPGFEVGGWQGIVVPAKTPASIVQRLNAEVNALLEDPEVRKTLAAQGAEPLGSTPAEYGAYIRGEIERWGAVARAIGVKLD